MTVGVVFLKIASLNEELATLFALDLLRLMASWQLQQILVGRDSFLLKL